MSLRCLWVLGLGFTKYLLTRRNSLKGPWKHRRKKRVGNDGPSPSPLVGFLLRSLAPPLATFSLRPCLICYFYGFVIFGAEQALQITLSVRLFVCFSLLQVVHQMLCFFLKMWGFFWTLPVLLQSWSSTCHLVVQAWSPVNTPRKNRERPESGIYLEVFEKTQYLMITLNNTLKFIKEYSLLRRLEEKAISNSIFFSFHVENNFSTKTPVKSNYQFLTFFQFENFSW